MSMEADYKPLFDGLGCLIEAEEGATFEQLCKLRVGALFERHGVVLFRGFQVGERNFLKCVEELSASLLRMDAPRRREAVAGSAATVLHDFAGQAIPLHSENSYLFPQFWPEALWFNCEVAPRTDGETTLCDGVAVWRELSDAARAALLARQLSYRVSLPRVLLDWGVNADARGSNIRAALDDARRGVPGVRIIEDGPEGVSAEITRYAIQRTRNGEDFAFVNHLLAGREPFLTGRIRFDDGQVVGAELIAELREIAEQHTHKLRWQPGDLVMIDNQRVMHGRTAYPVEEPRRLLSAMTAKCKFGFGHYARAA